MKRLLFTAIACGLALAIFVQPAPAQFGRLGDKIDRGLDKIGDQLSQAWSEAKQAVERMGLQGRVYARLHWDKALQGANLDIEVRDNTTIVLRGTVPTDVAREKAGSLASDTVGVSHVVNELTIAAPATAAKSAR